MKKQRMTADNVEQLMEIVRSLQQGEEPDMEKIRQKTRHEGFAEDAEPARVSGKSTKKKKKSAGLREETKGETGNRQASGRMDGKVAPGSASDHREDHEKSVSRPVENVAGDEAQDEFERYLQEEDSGGFEKEKALFSAFGNKISGWKKKLTQKRQKPEQREPANAVSGRSGQSAEDEAEDGFDMDARERAKEDVTSVRKQKSGMADDSQKSSKASESSQSEGNASRLSDGRERLASTASSGQEEEITEKGARFGKRKKKTKDAVLPEKNKEKSEDAVSSGGKKGRSEDATSSEGKKERSGDTVSSGSSKEKSEDIESSENKRKKSDKTRKNAKSGIGSAREISSGFAGAKDFWDNLNQKGIHGKELGMLIAGAILVLLLIILGINMVRNSLDVKRKSANVTADEGLVVTVEDEPDEWCSSYPVKLKVRTGNTIAMSVSVNGSTYQADEKGMITVEADDWLLEAAVVVEGETKKARIEIPKLDGDTPILEVEKTESQVTLSAVDARSSVKAIYYAATASSAYCQLPVYRRYSNPITYEEGTLYRFYAVDEAGNSSVPIVSTLESAQSFQLSQTDVSLFPGETCSLGVTAEPSGALLKNLKFESMDEQVLSVNENGRVTALKNGTTTVRVSADGLESQTCTFEVSTERSVTISAIGDCTLGTDESFNTTTNQNAFDAVYGHEYFFRNVREILENDDATLANFEGTLTNETTREAKQYAFKGDPSYTAILTEGSVEVVNLANNHSSDYGAQSLEDTKHALEEAGIDYCIGDTIAYRDVNGIRTAFIGIYELNAGMECESQVRETIAQAKAQNAELVIVSFHWGDEKATAPDDTQKSLAHTAVECGADLVVGHHPHVLQGIEQYNGKYIVYSLGNFCFGGNSAPSDKDTMIFRQTFTVSEAGVQPESQIEIIPCSVSSESGYNNYQPTPLQGEEAQRVMDRINEYSAEFGQTFTLTDDSEA